tara:strand:- start:2496 stop:3830 length:1335 start_codon:yes stop_codon:yes gene_type:complete
VIVVVLWVDALTATKQLTGGAQTRPIFAGLACGTGLVASATMLVIGQEVDTNTLTQKPTRRAYGDFTHTVDASLSCTTCRPALSAVLNVVLDIDTCVATECLWAGTITCPVVTCRTLRAGIVASHTVLNVVVDVDTNTTTLLYPRLLWAGTRSTLAGLATSTCVSAAAAVVVVALCVDTGTTTDDHSSCATEALSILTCLCAGAFVIAFAAVVGVTLWINTAPITGDPTRLARTRTALTGLVRSTGLAALSAVCVVCVGVYTCAVTLGRICFTGAGAIFALLVRTTGGRASLRCGGTSVELTGECAFALVDELTICVVITSAVRACLIDGPVAVVILSVTATLFASAVELCGITGFACLGVGRFGEDLLFALAPKSIGATRLKTVTTDPLVALVEFASEARLCRPWQTTRIALFGVVDFAITIIVDPIAVLDLRCDVTLACPPE